MDRSVQDTAFLPRETAADGDRMFTEDESKLLIAAQVSQETATLKARIAELEADLEAAKAEVTAVKDAKDVAEAAKEAAEQALTDYKTEVEQAKVVEGRKEARVAEVREILPHKPDEWFSERANAWAEKSDEDFAAWKAEMAEAIKGVTPEKANEDDPKPKATLSGREVAKDEGEDKGVAASVFDLLNRKAVG